MITRHCASPVEHVRKSITTCMQACVVMDFLSP